MTGERRPRVVLACDFHLKYTAGLTRGLAEIGCPATLLTRDHDGEFGGRPGAMRAYVHEMLDGRATHLELPGRPGRPADWRAVPRARRRLRKFSPEIVHLQDGVLNDPRLIAGSGARPGRYALNVHDVTSHPGDRRRGGLRPLVRRHGLIGSAGLIFVHAEAVRDRLQAEFAPRAPIVVIPRGVSPVPRAPLPPEPSLLFFGRIREYKGLDVLLDAMPRVWERLPHARLTIAGDGDRPHHPMLEDGRIDLRFGHVPEEEVPALYERSTTVVLPYREASQSGVGAFAKRHGRSLVVTRVGGLPELVTPETVRVVPSDDPAALADALLEVLTTPGLADAMGRAAAASVESERSWPRVAERLLDAYTRHLL